MGALDEMMRAAEPNPDDLRRPRSLSDYYEQNRAPRCVVCSLFNDHPDVAGQVRAGRRRVPAISYAVIVAWLRGERGITVSEEAVRKHFDKGHEK